MACNYEVGRFLGKGSFATVHLARDIRTRKHVAIKLVDVTACRLRQRRDRQQHGRPQQNEGGATSNAADEAANEESCAITSLLQREIDVHTSVSSSLHPNVVALLESFSYTNEITGSEMQALVLEHCSLGDLQAYMKRIRDQRKEAVQNGGGVLLPEGTFLSSNEIRHALSQVLSGLAFLHSRGVVHRDIKAPNVFLCPIQQQRNNGNNDKKTTTPKRRGKQTINFSLLECQLKLGDFGLAVQMKDDDDWYEAQTTFCGTPSCLAPEVVSQSAKPIMTKKYEQLVTRTNNNGTSSLEAKTEFDSLLGIDASLLTQQSMSLDKHVGYGQPADLWSTGCLLYTMIVGRNPFAVPANHPPTRDHQDSEMQEVEKSRRIQQIIERVIRCDWSVPAIVRMDEPLERILHQLLEEKPRKRGTARGILSVHPFFQIHNAMYGQVVCPRNEEHLFQEPNFSSSLNEKSATQNDEDNVSHCNWNARELSQGMGNTVMTKQKDCGESICSIDKAHIGGLRSSSSGALQYPNAPSLLASVSMVNVNNTLQNGEKMSHVGNRNVNEMSHRNHHEDPSRSIKHANSRGNEQTFSAATKYQDSLSNTASSSFENSKNIVQKKEMKSDSRSHANHIWHGIEKRHQHEVLQAKYSWEELLNNDTVGSDSTTDVISSASSLTAMEEQNDKAFGTRNDQFIRDAEHPKASIANMPQNEQFIPMKSLHRLPPRKHKCKELNQSSGGTVTVFFLGKEGVVIQRGSGAGSLWMHVMSDGVGVLCGKLNSQSSSHNQQGRPAASMAQCNNKKLLMEAYSCAPDRLSKQSLPSLLSLKFQDINSLYKTLESAVQLVKSYTPKITICLYKTHNAGNDSQESSSPGLFATTMLMENGPFAEIKTEFSDGTTIRISSSGGCISVKGDHGVTRLPVDQKRFFSALIANRSSSRPSSGIHQFLQQPSSMFVHYLCTFIESARECLLIEQHLDSGSFKDEGPNHDSYPFVQRVLANGWHQNDWVVIDNPSPV